jgi:hypothetical protein
MACSHTVVAGHRQQSIVWPSQTLYKETCNNTPAQIDSAARRPNADDDTLQLQTCHHPALKLLI